MEMGPYLFNLLSTVVSITDKFFLSLVFQFSQMSRRLSTTAFVASGRLLASWAFLAGQKPAPYISKTPKKIP